MIGKIESGVEKLGNINGDVKVKIEKINSNGEDID